MAQWVRTGTDRATAWSPQCHLPMPFAEPCPSTLLQQHMADLLRQGSDVAPSFLNSVLNQLNWAFSEFIGMIQEVGCGGTWGTGVLQRMRHDVQCGQATNRCPPLLVAQIQQAAERLERNFVDSRQLKVCATCFDLSVSLLRVLEMTITLVPEIFLDWSQPTSEMLLRRLAQVCPSGQGGWGGSWGRPNGKPTQPPMHSGPHSC